MVRDFDYIIALVVIHCPSLQYNDEFTTKVKEFHNRLEAAQHRMHLTAFGVGIAVLILNDVILLAIALVVFGGR